MSQKNRLASERKKLANDKWDGHKIEEIKMAEQKLSNEKSVLSYNVGVCLKVDCINRDFACDECVRHSRYEV